MKKEKLEEIVKHQKDIIEDLETELESSESKVRELSKRIIKVLKFIDDNYSYYSDRIDYQIVKNRFLEDKKKLEKMLRGEK